MTTGFQPLDLASLYGLELPEPEWLVDELIPLGTVGLLSAREKAGKGLLTIDLCASIAAGEPFLDAAVMEGPAIYCAAEENLRDVRSRIIARMGDDPRWPFLVLPLNGFTEDRLKLEDADSVQRLTLMIEEHRPLLVVLDTLRELHDGAEDSSDDMAWRMRSLRVLAHHTNTTIVLNHHMNRGGTFRGSTAIRAATDWELAFTRTQDGLVDSVAGSLRRRGRQGADWEIGIRFDPVSSRWSSTVAPVVADSSLRSRILGALAQADDWRTAEQISVTLEPVKLKTVQNEIARMGRENPLPFAISGMATRGNPRRFRSLHSRVEEADRVEAVDSPRTGALRGRESGNNPKASGNDPGLIPSGRGDDTGTAYPVPIHSAPLG